MVFASSALSYSSGGEELALTIDRTKLAVCLKEEDTEALRAALAEEPIARHPLDIRRIRGTIFLIALTEGATEEGALELIDRLNRLPATRYASPVFTAPSSRAVLTHEIIAKFEAGTSPTEIETLVAEMGLRILRPDYPMARSYLLGFTSKSGANPLEAARSLRASPRVAYAHPNLLLLLDPPGGIPAAGDGARPGAFLSEENAALLNPNAYMDLQTMGSQHPWSQLGWETIVEERFDGPTALSGWTNEDRNPGHGQYFWGPVSDAVYPDIARADYDGEGNKGWVALSHAPGEADRLPSGVRADEAYAPEMDTWLIWGPMDLTDTLWARLRFQAAFYAPHSETFGWYASIDGQTWSGRTEAGVGDDGNLWYWRPYLSTDPPQKGVYFDLTHVPELGDLTGSDHVYVALRFQSDDTLTPWPAANPFPFYGVFLHDIVVEQHRRLGASTITADPLSDRQWGLRNQGQAGGTAGLDIHAPEAWQLLEETGGVTMPGEEESEVIVAVLDEGVDLDHEDLRLVAGYDATYDPEGDPGHEDSRGGPLPGDGHGTACAGIIGARANGSGVVGVAPGVKIMPVRVAYTPEGANHWATTFAQLADGILWAVDHGAQVLSNSWGGGFPSDLLIDAIYQADAAGVVLVFAAGNNNQDYPGFPASAAKTICVGAMSPCGERTSPDSCDGEWWWGSDYGAANNPDRAQVDVMAPGVLIATTDITGDGGYVPANETLGKNGNYFVSFNGTSSACPHVAGVLALMLSAEPHLSPEMARSILHSSATDIGDVGWDYETGHGLVNAQEAVRQAIARSRDLRITATEVGDFLYVGRTNPVEVTILNDGEDPTGAFYLQLYLSSDTQVDGGDTFLWYGTTSLDAGAEGTVTANVLVPEGTPTGPYNLLAFADGQETVVERNEDNNVLARPVQVAGAPALVVKPGAVDFGTVQVGAAADRTVHLKNEGEGDLAPLTIAAITLAGDSMFDNPDNLLPTTPLVLGGNESSELWLYFAPTSAGHFSGSITLGSNDPDAPMIEVPLVGTAVEPQPVLAVTGVPVDFGAMATTSGFQIENPGDAPLQWSIDASQAPGWLTHVTPLSGTTEPGTSSTIALTVTRNLVPVGTYGWDLPVISNGGNGNAHITIIVPGQTLSVSPMAIDFGKTGTVATITVANSGDFAIDWTMVNNLPAWLSTDPMVGTLAAGASAPVHLQTHRSGLAPGPYAHTLDLGSTGGGASVAVSMTVVAESVPVLTAHASPASGPAPLTVAFTTSVTGGDPPLTFSWDFGDGEASAEASPSHVYTTPDSYTASVTVTDANGDTDSAELSVQVTAAPPTWSRSLGHGETYTEYHAYGIEAAADGGVVVSAESVYHGAGDYDYWILRLDTLGTLLWERGLGGPSGDHPNKVRQDADGGFVVAGDSYSFRTGDRYADAWIVKLTESGAIDWQHTYGGTATDTIRDIRPVRTGTGEADGYIAVGDTTSFGAGGYDLWLLRLDPTGALVWAKAYGGSANEFGRAVRQTPDGGFIVVGDTQSFGAGNRDLWVLRLNDSGAVTWEETLGGAAGEIPDAVELAGDGGYVVGATTDSFGAGGNDYWVLKLDAAGALSWQSTYGGVADDYAQDLDRTGDGGYIMSGWSYSFGVPFMGSINNDAWVVKLDGEGGIEWQKIYNKPFDEDGAIINGPDWAYGVVETTDGGYAISGDTDWWDPERETDVWVFKVDGQGNLGCAIETETTALRSSSAPVVGSAHAYSVVDSAVVVQTPTPAPYTLGPDTFGQCGP